MVSSIHIQPPLVLFRFDLMCLNNLLVPSAVAKNAFEVNQRTNDVAAAKQYFYKPSLFVDEIGLTSDKYVHLNNTVQTLPLKISIGPMSTQVHIIYSSKTIFLSD
jgi:hypothetical protein